MSFQEDELSNEPMEPSREDLQREILQLRKALEKAEERIELMLKATNDALYDWDLLSGHLSWNEGFLGLIGYERESIEHTIDFWSSHLHPEEKERVEASLQRVFEQGDKHWEQEYRFRRKDGSYAHVLERGYVVYDAQSKAIRMVGALQDVSDRKESALALEALTAEYSFLLHQIPSLVFRTTSEGKADFVNSRWQEYTGLTLEELLGDGWAKALHPLDIEPTMQAWQEALDSHQMYQTEYRLLKHDGTYHWFQAQALPYKDNAGNILKWFGTCTDMEEVKQAQQRLENTLEELHEKNFELDQFVYKTSHDLRAPLTSILGLVSLIKVEPKESSRQEYVDLIENRVQKLDGFIQSMLAYSRNTRTKPKRESIDCGLLLEECLRELSSLKHFDRLKISWQVKGSRLYSDHFRLKIILSNLISNAIKYQDFAKQESYLTLTIRVSQTGASLDIEDNGVGINESYQDRIFDMFFRATEQSEGSGLGLYIVKQAVSALQGTITLASQTGQGTQFKIWLPNSFPE